MNAVWIMLGCIGVLMLGWLVVAIVKACMCDKKKNAKAKLIGTTVTWKEEGCADMTLVYPSLDIIDAMDMESLKPDPMRKTAEKATIDSDGWGNLVFTIRAEKQSTSPPTDWGDIKGIDAPPYTKPPEQSTCKRCGVVYVPRCLKTIVFGIPRDDGAPDTWVRQPPYKSDGRLLVSNVNPKDYCPTCEEHLEKVREKLLAVLAPRKKTTRKKTQKKETE